MQKAVITTQMSAPGANMTGRTTLEGESGLPPCDFMLAGGKAGTLTARTDDNTASITAAGHGLSNGNIVDVFWSATTSGVTTYYVHHGATIGTISGNVIPIDGGDGDALPSTSTSVVICKVTDVAIQFTGNLVLAFGASCSARSHVAIIDDASAVAWAAQILPGGFAGWTGAADPNTANPLEDKDIIKLRVSNGGTSEGRFNFGGLLDAVEV